MAYQPEVVSYDAGIYQLEIVDPVDGGVGAVSNKPLLSLANRTAYLYQHVTNLENGATIPPGIAVINSQAFTGTPTVPTPALGDNSLKISNTAFVQGTVNGLASINVAGGVNVALTAIQAGTGILVFTGALTASISVIVPTSPKTMIVENLTSGAYTLTVKTAAGTGIAVTQGKTQELFCDGTNVLLSSSDFVNMALTGIPTAPTAALGTNTTQVATVAFANATAAAAAGAVPTTPLSTAVPLVDSGTGAVGTSTSAARADHVHPTDTTRAPLASPALTGIPTAPTAALGTNTTQVATVAFANATAAAATTPLSATTPSMDSGAGAVGTSTSAARADHVHPTDTTRVNKSGDTMTGNLQTLTQSETTTSPAISGGALTLNLALSNVFQVALNANVTTLTISNPPAVGTAFSFTVVVTANGTGYSWAWPSWVHWPSNVAPTITSISGKQDRFVFETTDGGATYRASVAGQNL